MKRFGGDGGGESAASHRNRNKAGHKGTPLQTDESSWQGQSAARKKINLAIRVALIAVFLFTLLLAIAVILYLPLSDYLNEKDQSRAMNSYNKAMQGVAQKENVAQREAAIAYNEALAQAETPLYDALLYGDSGDGQTGDYWGILNALEDGVMGYVQVKALDIKLPIYHGTSENAISNGAGHLYGSSLPIGGQSSHAVIVSHTGLPTAQLFTRIDQMKTGDVFTLTVLDEVLAYQVDQIVIVTPSEIEDLAIEKGKDYASLVTCTPYGINTHRLLVRGSRIETPPEFVEQTMGAGSIEQEKSNWMETLFHKIAERLSLLFEKVARALVHFAQWGMNVFGIQYE